MQSIHPSSLPHRCVRRHLLRLGLFRYGIIGGVLRNLLVLVQFPVEFEDPFRDVFAGPPSPRTILYQLYRSTAEEQLYQRGIGAATNLPRHRSQRHKRARMLPCKPHSPLRHPPPQRFDVLI